MKKEIVTLYADILDQMGRAVAQHARATEPMEQRVLATAMHVLQGRLEGVGLVWYALHGNDDGSEDELRVAAMEIRRER